MLPKIQLGLRKFLLIILACAAWLAYIGNEHRRSNSKARLIQLLKETRSLDVQDTSKLTARATSGRTSFSSSLGTAPNKISAYHSFQCFVPDSGWEICLTTRVIADKGFPSNCKTAPLRKGTSEIQLTVATTQDGYEILVLVEGTATFAEHEDNTWCNQHQLQPDSRLNSKVQTDHISPIELTRMRMGKESLSKGKSVVDMPSLTNGVLIWMGRSGKD